MKEKKQSSENTPLERKSVLLKKILNSVQAEQVVVTGSTALYRVGLVK